MRAPDFIVKQHTTQEEFELLREEWDALLQQSENNEITLTWEWLYTWWEVFKDSSRKLMILTVRDGSGQLVGIAPLQVREVRPYPFLPKIRQFEFLASGEDEADEICSDYLNFIVRRGREQEVLSKIVDYLATDLAGEWDEIFLTDMLAESETTRQFEALIGDYPLRYERTTNGPCFYIDLPKTWDEFLMGLGSRTRYETRRDRRALSKLGKITYHVATNEHELEQCFAILIDLHQKRWSEKGKAGVFSSEKFLAFHKTLLPLALNRNWLKLSVLFLNESPIAAVYNFSFNNKIYFYQCGTNIWLGKHISPGLVLHSCCIEEAISEGLREYDFLKGGPGYKERWAKGSRDLISIRTSSKSIKARGVGTVRTTINHLRSLKRSIRSVNRMAGQR